MKIWKTLSSKVTKVPTYPIIPPKHPKIIFFNQMAGRLFRELAQGLSEVWYPSILYTGHPDTLAFGSTDKLYVKSGPVYDKRTTVRRVWSWLEYFFVALYHSLKAPRSSLLFISTNPPILGLVGYINKKLFGKKYIILVYDIYPEILISLGWLKKNGIISRTWQFINRLSWENAEVVITLGEFMAKNLKKQFDVSKTKLGRIFVVSPWVDTNFIKPIKKSENWFAKKHGQVDKLTILYSGNLGATHSVELIANLAKALEHEKDIHFLIIGDGFKKHLLEKPLKRENLPNITLLSSQPEDVLPYSLTTGDIALITMAPGTEGYMVPSTFPYYMAAGCYLLYIGNKESEIGVLCQNHTIGKVLPNEASNISAGFIKWLNLYKKRLDLNKNDSFRITQNDYARKENIVNFVQVVQYLHPM